MKLMILGKIRETKKGQLLLVLTVFCAFVTVFVFLGLDTTFAMFVIGVLGGATGLNNAMQSKENIGNSTPKQP